MSMDTRFRLVHSSHRPSPAAILKTNRFPSLSMLRYCAVISLCAGLACGADFFTGQAARLVIGQSTFTSQDSGASATLLGAVGGVAFANNTLVVADANRTGLTPLNARVLVFSNFSNTLPGPTTSFPVGGGRCPVCTGVASSVLGQPDFATTTANITQAGLRLPTAVATDGKYLAVADTAANRVLIWNNIPLSNGVPARSEEHTSELQSH